MTDLVLLSHGNFCKGIKEGAEMILGPQKNIHTIDLKEGESPEHFQTRFLNLTGSLEKFVVFTDILGGTPYNVAYKSLLSSENKFELYTGMNLPMIISYVNAQLVSSSPDLVGDAKNGIKFIEAKYEDSPDDEF
ncbi:PTS fructose transporter subunit IIA [Lactobacillus kullabergensis]|uniref:PTS sugar transporter subunit IIA n=1 Tax=Lactobacillus TaxID=1578 RepID=UPI0018DD1918|nr:PTS fructose transporter subunit IIA [Lactobacillus kullabergensis]MBI0121278.1 PTS fructose transporter subunit IIA [Lactobacillus sp. M0398]MBI0123425.1 PTS fructose transporter subunit IIA [Lactobacillus sp. W8174]MBI0135510.1 PTS fructose transporter subunit IIA [Lactobacillus sp. W8173]MCT6807722.1 PTS fructose transporter subunit IIA [Bombilactobacillus sp.]MCX0291563.1 PTS fructose transporter subunit IIA [Lactobacillus kullabergensis]